MPYQWGDRGIEYVEDWRVLAVDRVADRVPGVCAEDLLKLGRPRPDLNSAVLVFDRDRRRQRPLMVRLEGLFRWIEGYVPEVVEVVTTAVKRAIAPPKPKRTRLEGVDRPLSKAKMRRMAKSAHAQPRPQIQKPQALPAAPVGSAVVHNPDMLIGGVLRSRFARMQEDAKVKRANRKRRLELQSRIAMRTKENERKVIALNAALCDRLLVEENVFSELCTLGREILGKKTMAASEAIGQVVVAQAWTIANLAKNDWAEKNEAGYLESDRWREFLLSMESFYTLFSDLMQTIDDRGTPEQKGRFLELLYLFAGELAGAADNAITGHQNALWDAFPEYSDYGIQYPDEVPYGRCYHGFFDRGSFYLWLCEEYPDPSEGGFIPEYLRLPSADSAWHNAQDRGGCPLTDLDASELALY